MLVLGISGDPKPTREDRLNIFSEWEAGWYHDASAVLVKDGQVVAGIEEERLTRRKHSGKLPVSAIGFCLREAAAVPSDIDFVAYGELGGIGEYRNPALSAQHIGRILDDCMQPGIPPERIQLIEHHVAHAFSAFGPSGFREALVFTADGFGDGISGLVMDVSSEHCVIMRRTSVRDSLGNLYASVLSHLGYQWGDEYKVMGLAPYGDPKRYGVKFSRLFDLLAHGEYQVVPHIAETMDALLNGLGPNREPDGEFCDHHRDIAAGIQDVLETIVFHTLQHFRRATGRTHLCIAGGVGQNSLLNGKLLRGGLFDDIYVQPAAHDGGLALGAALHVESEAGKLSSPRRLVQTNVFWGPRLPHGAELQRSLERWKPFIDFHESAEISSEVAQLLNDGEVVGWAQGRSEFGPRALGNRSILADPRPAENKGRINSLIKDRESYRPFAPAVMEEHAAEFFQLPDKQTRLPYMTFVVPVREEKRKILGAVTHVDGGARIQTVSKEDNHCFWRLLGEFNKIAGIPILLNTSFNSRIEPIVDSVDDIIACLLTTGLSCAAIENFLISKRKVGWESYLTLRPKIYGDGALMRFYTREPNTVANPAWALSRKHKRIFPVSEQLFKLLCFDYENRPALELVRDGCEDTPGKARLGRELWEAWSNRMIVLAPGKNDISPN
jgi:carbamoyltransferase